MIEVFSVAALVAVSVYFAQDSPALGLAVFVPGAVAALAFRMIAAERRAAAHAGDEGAVEGARVDVELPPLIARYRGRSSATPSTRTPALTVALFGCVVLLALEVVPTVRRLHRIVSLWPVEVGLLLAAAIGLATALAADRWGDRVEHWLYADRLARVRNRKVVWWPFDRIDRLRYPGRRGARDDGRVEWIDADGRRLVVADTYSSRHLVALLEAATIPALAARRVAGLRANGALAVTRPSPFLGALLPGLAVGIALCATSATLYSRNTRDTLVEAWLLRRADRLSLGPQTQGLIDVATVGASWVLVWIGQREWRRRRGMVLTRCWMVSGSRDRAIPWSSVRRVSLGPTALEVDTLHGPASVDRRAWDAPLVAHIAQLLRTEVPAS